MPSMPSLMEQGLQFQQLISAIPVVLVKSQTNQLNTTPFCTVTSPKPSTYVTPSKQQVPIFGGQAQFTSAGNHQLSSPLTLVSVPKFFGQKKNYETWKVAFYSCVGRTRAMPKYKILHLWECLPAEPLKAI